MQPFQGQDRTAHRFPSHEPFRSSRAVRLSADMQRADLKSQKTTVSGGFSFSLRRLEPPLLRGSEMQQEKRRRLPVR